MKDVDKQESHQRHHSEMAEKSDHHAFSGGPQSGEILQAHVGAHSEHHQLDDDQDEGFIPQVDPAPVFEILRIDHGGGHGRDDPGGVAESLESFGSAG